MVAAATGSDQIGAAICRRATIEAATEAEAITKFSNGEWSQAKREFDDHQIQEIYEIEYRGD